VCMGNALESGRRRATGGGTGRTVAKLVRDRHDEPAHEAAGARAASGTAGAAATKFVRLGHDCIHGRGCAAHPAPMAML
jgi:hypothetical protein